VEEREKTREVFLHEPAVEDAILGAFVSDFDLEK
jgi:hypothetical protein